MTTRSSGSAIAVTASLLILAGCGSSGSGSGSKEATAQPADVAKAVRTVDIKATDDLKFDPAKVSVKRGETVAFKVSNPTKVDHEFEVGDAAFQQQHDEEMKRMGPDMNMADEATGFVVKVGETKTIAFTFPSTGTVLYGCHEPGHYPGMKGDIEVT
ncbi:MAG: hypothetical protein V7605_2452 [Acidimicrobiaceae bacterium]|jgi:uncharacterized cupredoxin-like copper-binding protein